MNRLLGLAPVVNADTRLVVLGSFPSAASLRAQQYYGHPQNQFWRILGALWAMPLPEMPYEERLAVMLDHRVGLWDVYGACEREGSLDTNIRRGELNDFGWLKTQCPRLEAIAHNGSESFKHARHTEILGVSVYKLPSTSPAHASWRFERKLAAWSEAFVRHGLTT